MERLPRTVVINSVVILESNLSSITEAKIFPLVFIIGITTEEESCCGAKTAIKIVISDVHLELKNVLKGEFKLNSIEFIIN